MAALLVYMTLPAVRDAGSLARDIVESRLAAGVNIAGPIRSVYRWKGEIREEAEWLIFAQTSESGLEALKAFIASRHPHECPCLMAVPIQAGFAPFLQWAAARGSP